MIRNRGPFSAGPSKAGPQTLCQKCLKRDRSIWTDQTKLRLTRLIRHYSYECKTTTQERPYASRPSRTQQLANPKLVPKLSSDVPNELLRKKGIADEQLAQKEEERGRKRALDEYEPPNTARKRPRSISSYSATSVSTISTNLSRSASPKRPRLSDIRPSDKNGNRKRMRSSSSSDASYSSDDPYHRRRKSQVDGPDRNTRRRRSSNSPRVRGRDRDMADKRRPPRSRSDSMDKGQIARHRNSMTPDIRPIQDRSNGRAPKRHSYPNDDDRYGSSYRDRGRGERDEPPAKQPHAPPVQKERSLSPFSKRLALTQAMNMGR